MEKMRKLFMGLFGYADKPEETVQPEEANQDQQKLEPLMPDTDDATPPELSIDAMLLESPEQSETESPPMFSLSPKRSPKMFFLPKKRETVSESQADIRPKPSQSPRRPPRPQSSPIPIPPRRNAMTR